MGMYVHSYQGKSYEIGSNLDFFKRAENNSLVGASRKDSREALKTCFDQNKPKLDCSGRDAYLVAKKIRHEMSDLFTTDDKVYLAMRRIVALFPKPASEYTERVQSCASKWTVTTQSAEKENSIETESSDDENDSGAIGAQFLEELESIDSVKNWNLKSAFESLDGDLQLKIMSSRKEQVTYLAKQRVIINENGIYSFRKKPIMQIMLEKIGQNRFYPNKGN